jgi:hypothetical protein
MAGRWWRLRNQMVDFGIQRLQVAGGDHARNDDIAVLDEEARLVVAEEGRAQSTSS